MVVGTVVGGATYLAPANISNTLATDGTAHNTITSGTSATCSLSTAVANDILVLAVATTGALVSSVSDTSSLKWYQRAANSNGASNHLEEWVAYTSGILTSDTITVTLATSGTAVFAVVAFKNSFYTAPFDYGVLTTTEAAATTTPTTTFSTTNPVTIAIGIFGWISGGSFTAGSGFTSAVTAANSTSISVGIEYETFTTAQSATACGATLGSSTAYVEIVDALMQNGLNIAAIQATSSQEWVIHNIGFTGSVYTLTYTSGQVVLVQDSYNGPSALGSIFQHINNSASMVPIVVVLLNTSTSAGSSVNWNGVQTT